MNDTEPEDERGSRRKRESVLARRYLGGLVIAAILVCVCIAYALETDNTIPVAIVGSLVVVAALLGAWMIDKREASGTGQNRD